MAIGTGTIKAIAASLQELLGEYQIDIDKAYLKAEGPLVITLGAKISPGMPSNIETKISFVAEKISDTASFAFNEDQIDMFNED